MSMRSAVTALGVTLALAVMLTATTTPAFAAKSNGEQGKPPSVVVETRTPKSKVEQARSQSVANAPSSKQEIEQPFPGSGGNSSPGSNAVTTGATNQQVSAAVAGAGTTVPGIPAGSVVPSGYFAPGYQQVPGPLFQGPLPGVATSSSGPANRQESGLTVDAIDSRSPAPTLARPDVRVVYVDSAAISLSSVVREQSDTSNGTRRVEEQHAQIGALAAGQAQDVVVTCTPRSGFRCVSGALDASVANDLSPTNNSAHS